MKKDLSQEVERLARIVERMTTPVATVPHHSQESIDAAVALAKTASATATALADAKAKSDIDSALMANNLNTIKEDIKEIKDVLKNQDINYVSTIDFKQHLIRYDDHEARMRTLEKESEDHALVKKVVYGAVSFILLAVLGAIIFLVVK